MKPLLVFQAPIATRSGYGERSRDLLRALIALDKYDIKVVGTRWGSTPMNALTDQDQDILSRVLTTQLNQKPDVYMQVTVPNEFQPLGHYNIGVTAGIETDACDSSWLEGCNRMDLILVSSNHAKTVFEQTRYTAVNPETQQPVGELTIQKPIEVLFEGIRLDKFSKEYQKSESIEEAFSKITEDFCFLTVGHWLPGAFGEDRKNIGGVIKCFYEAFKNKSNAPALVMKISGGAYSTVDRAELKKKVDAIKGTMDTKNLPNVYIMYGDYSEEEMNDLYNHPKVKAHVSFTKGEGFGRPLIEAALTGKPIIASNWSGHIDFLNKETSVLVEGQLTNVHPSAAWKGVLNTESKWFSINFGDAIAYMKDMFKDYKKYQEKSRKTYHHIKTNFSFDAMKDKLNSILTNQVKEAPKMMSLNLPKLKKVGETTEAPKITLPKLKKIEG